jgi:hypothetical protein
MSGGWKEGLRTLDSIAAETGRRGPSRTDTHHRRQHMSQAYAGGCAAALSATRFPPNRSSRITAMSRLPAQSGTGHGSYMTFAGRNAVKLTGQATPVGQ